MGDTVQQMFTAIAQHYDQLNTILSFGLHHRWRRRVVAASAAQPGARLLDLCSGTADLALAFAERLGGSGQIIATDFCTAMLAHGRRKALQQQAPLHFALADAQALPFADGLFDIVTVAFGLRNVAHLAGALQEIFRVLRPGGVALILEFGQPQGPLFGPAYRFYARHVLPRIGGWLSGHRDAYTYLPRTAAVFPAGPRFVQELESQQFTSICTSALSGGIVYLYRATRPAAVLLPHPSLHA